MYYVDKWGNVRYFPNERFSPPFLQYKLTFLTELKSVAIKYDENNGEGRQSYDIPYLIRWMKWKRSTVLFFNNGRLEASTSLEPYGIRKPASSFSCCPLGLKD